MIVDIHYARCVKKMYLRSKLREKHSTVRLTQSSLRNDYIAEPVRIEHDSPTFFAPVAPQFFVGQLVLLDKRLTQSNRQGIFRPDSTCMECCVVE